VSTLLSVVDDAENVCVVARQNSRGLPSPKTRGPLRNGYRDVVSSYHLAIILVIQSDFQLTIRKYCFRVVLGNDRTVYSGHFSQRHYSLFITSRYS
jgi:hypothetical protein